MTQKGRTLLVFADEGRQNEERYMVIGGVIITEHYEEINNLREQIKYIHEFKWHKLSSSKFDEYKSFIDILFDNYEYIHFRAIAVDTNEYNRSKGDKELGFYKKQFISSSNPASFSV